MAGWRFRSTGWPIGHPVNVLGEALPVTIITINIIFTKKQYRSLSLQTVALAIAKKAATVT